MKAKQIMDALIKMGKVQDGHVPFMGCDTIGQDGLYEIQELLMDLMDMLDHERSQKEFPWMYETVNKEILK